VVAVSQMGYIYITLPTKAKVFSLPGFGW